MRLETHYIPLSYKKECIENLLSTCVILKRMQPVYGLL